MSTVQVWTMKAAMASASCYAAIRSLRQTELVGAAKAVVDSVLRVILLLGLIFASTIAILAMKL